MKGDRRDLLKALTLGGGAVTVSQLPATWSKPVVDSVMLPAHAQTTSPEMFRSRGSQDFQQGSVDAGDAEQFHRIVGSPILDSLLQEAQAITNCPPEEEEEEVTQSRAIANMSGNYLLMRIMINFEIGSCVASSNDQPGSLFGAIIGEAHAGASGPGSFDLEACVEGNLSLGSWRTLSYVSCPPIFGTVEVKLLDDDGSTRRYEVMCSRFGYLGIITLYEGDEDVPCDCSAMPS